MTSRNLPAIKRVRQTRYVSSDGRAFDSHVEAFRHETEIALRNFIQCHKPISQDYPTELAKALLAAEDFRIVLLGPKTTVRPEGGESRP